MRKISLKKIAEVRLTGPNPSVIIRGMFYLKCTLNHPYAIIPRRARRGDLGYDLFSCESKSILPGEWEIFNTRVRIYLDRGYAGLVLPRSGLALAHGITVLNAPGLIDAGYEGDIKVILQNQGRAALDIPRGIAIAQLLIQKVCTPVISTQANAGDYYKEKEREFIRAHGDDDSLKPRGDAGFGSTGTLF